MSLLTAHKILVAFALGLGLVLILWSVTHRHQPGAIYPALLGLLTVPLWTLYLRKLSRHPPIH